MSFVYCKRIHSNERVSLASKPYDNIIILVPYSDNTPGIVNGFGNILLYHFIHFWFFISCNRDPEYNVLALGLFVVAENYVELAHPLIPWPNYIILFASLLKESRIISNISFICWENEKISIHSWFLLHSPYLLYQMIPWAACVWQHEVLVLSVLISLSCSHIHSSFLQLHIVGIELCVDNSRQWGIFGFMPIRI